MPNHGPPGSHDIRARCNFSSSARDGNAAEVIFGRDMDFSGEGDGADLAVLA